MRSIAILGALAAAAAADPGVQRLEVAIDQTVVLEVGNLIGFHCDQPKLVDARMTTRKDARGEVNVFSVKGVAVGTTQCRIGSDALGAFKLVEVVVTTDPPKRR